MATTLTKLDVWNLALDSIREAPLQTTMDQSPAGRFLRRNYDHVVDSALRKYPWNFAKEKHQLSRDPVDPTFGWTARYQLPPNTVRVLGFYPDGDDRQLAVRHEIVGNYIETNETSPINIKVIVRKDEPGEWDSLFVELVKCKLAVGLAKKFTGKAAILQLAQRELQNAEDEAALIDTLEGDDQQVEQHDILRVRGADTYDTRWR